METTQVDNRQHADEVSNTKRRILVLLAHPSLDRSEVNRPMAEAIDGLDGVTLIDLYAEYPDFQIDIDREQASVVCEQRVVRRRIVELREDRAERAQIGLEQQTVEATPGPFGFVGTELIGLGSARGRCRNAGLASVEHARKTSVFDDALDDDPDTAAAWAEAWKDLRTLQPDDVARAIEFAVTSPDHVSVSELLVRPTDQPT